MQLAPLRRGFAILRFLANQSQPCQFKVLQKAFPDIGDASMTRLLSVMLNEQLVAKDNLGRYELGEAFICTAQLALDALPRKDVLRPIIVRAAERFRNTISYWEPEANGMVTVVKHEVTDSCVVFDEGRENSRITRHPPGQVRLAYLSAEERAAAVEAAPQPPVPSRTVFERRMAKIRKERVLHDPGDASKANTRVAAPVFRDDEFTGVVMINAPGRHYSETEKNELATQVKSLAAELTSALTPS